MTILDRVSLCSQSWSEPSYIARAALNCVSLLTNPLSAAGTGVCYCALLPVHYFLSTPSGATPAAESGPCVPANSFYLTFVGTWDAQHFGGTDILGSPFPPGIRLL